VLIGINLLREGLDMPEVSLVAILDADQEGFLRSDRSLIQTVGRAARHVNGRAIFYGDRITGSMQRCLDETGRRRALQVAHNEAHGITPKGVVKSVDQVRLITRVADAREEREEQPDRRGRKKAKVAESAPTYGRSSGDIATMITELEAAMKSAAKELDFEAAARIRDQLFELKAKQDSSGSGTSRPARGSLSAIRQS
jgi:excinuclease ABC subunit B